MARWLLVLVLLAGCKNASGGGGATTTSLSPPVTVTATTAQPTTTSPTSFEVPAEIDLPYVQRVLKTIYHLDGEATRYLYAKKIPDAELYERLEAIFGDPELGEAKTDLGEHAAEKFVLFADPPGDAIVRAVEIVQATRTCIVVRADLEYGPRFKESRPPLPQAIIQLGPADILPFNPTGWGVVVAGQPKPGQDLKVC